MYEATCMLQRNSNNTTTVIHSRPHESRPSNAALEGLSKQRKLRPVATLRQMVMGNNKVKGTRKLHPPIGNTDRV